MKKEKTFVENVGDITYKLKEMFNYLCEEKDVLDDLAIGFGYHEGYCDSRSVVSLQTEGMLAPLLLYPEELRALADLIDAHKEAFDDGNGKVFEETTLQFLYEDVVPTLH